jgi:hypothetical protein
MLYCPKLSERETRLMPRMIDSIRNSTLPSNMMQFAARGALLVPPQEMIEILVYLVNHNKVFGPQARLTLAGWDEKSALEAAANPATPKEVLDYLIDHENLRPALLPALLENPAVNPKAIVILATLATKEQVEVLFASQRVRSSQEIMRALLANPHAGPLMAQLNSVGSESTTPSASASAEVQSASAEPVSDLSDSQEVPDEAVHAFLAEHAADIVSEGEKPFQPIGGIHDEGPAQAAEAPVEVQSAAAASASAGSPAATTVAVGATRATPKKKSFVGTAHEKGSALKKIALLDVKGRINLAMKGNKEERSLLIRDGTKVVALAVLESPKITDAEVEKFASQKNVLEAVLRAIPMKRRFAKQYAVVRNLTFNPRTPIDVSLGLLKHLLIQDLRHLSGNKEVSETVRKLAMKMFRQKLDVTKKN